MIKLTSGPMPKATDENSRVRSRNLTRLPRIVGHLLLQTQRKQAERSGQCCDCDTKTTAAPLLFMESAPRQEQDERGGGEGGGGG